MVRAFPVLVRKADVVPIECVVRGYLTGSGWKEYQKSTSVCGIPLPKDLTESSALPEPIFTPATKATSGHDINISFEAMVEAVGSDIASELRERSLNLYTQAVEHAAARDDFSGEGADRLVEHEHRRSFSVPSKRHARTRSTPRDLSASRSIRARSPSPASTGEQSKP